MAIVLAAMVAILQLSGSARALTEPDCPVMEGTGKLLVNLKQPRLYGPCVAASARQKKKRLREVAAWNVQVVATEASPMQRNRYNY